MKISVVIINKNEGCFLRDCLESAKFAYEIIVVDGGSSDESLTIAKEYKVKVVTQKGDNFASWRNEGREESKGDWILYLDADERITPLLKREILETIDSASFSSFAIPRRNFLLGKELRFGGWYPDYVLRLFLKKDLEKWEGKLHERPHYKGQMGKIENALVHLQPEKIEPALEKSIKWSQIEARLIFESKHPTIFWWRILRMASTTLFERLIKKQGFRDGTEGWIESIYQAFHTMIVYLRVWEMQGEKK